MALPRWFRATDAREFFVLRSRKLLRICDDAARIVLQGEYAALLGKWPLQMEKRHKPIDPGLVPPGRARLADESQERTTSELPGEPLNEFA